MKYVIKWDSLYYTGDMPRWSTSQRSAAKWLRRESAEDVVKNYGPLKDLAVRVVTLRPKRKQ